LFWLHLITAIIRDDSSIRHRNIVLAPCRELMGDPALSARRPLLDERRQRATLVTGDRLELRPGAGVENELSAQLGAVFVFQITLASARLLLGIGQGHE
jgi:hypothetical protein